jgi:parvulin-like peptidyl-prolyl isomerase
MKRFNFIFLSVLFLVSFRANSEVVDRIIAVVNSEIITISDLKSFGKKLNQNGMVDELLLLGKKQDDLKKSTKDQVAFLINERIIESEIKRLNLAVTLERVDQEIRDIAKRNRVSKSDLLEAIKGQGMSIADYQEFIKNRIERQSLIESEISSKIRVSDEDVLAHYQRKNKGLNTGVYEYSLSHIYLNPKKGGADKAKERAEMALKKIQSGESFEAVAEQFSEDPNFTTGGVLGSFKAGEFSKEFEAAVSNLNVGDVSKPVFTKTGIHLLKVTGKKIVSDPQFEKEKDKIRSELFEAAFQKNFRTWLEMKKEDAFIRINSES